MARKSPEDIQTSIQREIESTYPCRKGQIEALLVRCAAQTGGGEPVFVFGPHSTGKTAIVKECMRRLQCLYVYVSGLEYRSPREVCGAILKKLVLAVKEVGCREGGARGGRRKREEVDDGVRRKANKRSESVSEFLVEVETVLKDVEGSVWIVVDKAERLVREESGLLAALSRMGEMCEADVRLIFISSMSWNAGGGYARGRNKAILNPYLLEFEAYSVDELVKVCMYSQDVGDAILLGQV